MIIHDSHSNNINRTDTNQQIIGIYNFIMYNLYVNEYARKYCKGIFMINYITINYGVPYLMDM